MKKEKLFSESAHKIKKCFQSFAESAVFGGSLGAGSTRGSTLIRWEKTTSKTSLLGRSSIREGGLFSKIWLFIILGYFEGIKYLSFIGVVQF